MKKVWLSLILAAAMSLSVLWACLGPSTEQLPAMAPFGGYGSTLVIDPGHGGEDGGAVSLTGAAESQINLSIARKLEDLLALYGTMPVMLRREDVSLHDKDAKTLREKKVSDLHNRVAMIRETEEPVLLSIHQNSYPEARYHGAQVFYAPTTGSRELAEHLQEVLIAGLDPDNRRTAKLIPDSIYLMNHITCPAVLVECGFLTNPNEEALLQQDSYQRRIALSLTSALLTASEDTNED